MAFESGTVQLYTGNGKGKTTAAVGQAVRAAGHGKRVIMIQFMKGKPYGELAAADRIEGLTIEQYGRDEFVDRDNPAAEDIELAMNGWRRAEELVRDDTLDMLILDEINVAVAFGLVPLESVVALVRNKPVGLELVLTGRYAPDELIALADTVTEMREIRHHYNRGVKARKGIEY
ncbi:MAG TPA: cob(I)yrinic acid a,c-diamide adenosyltransferase [Patescibacteria group bacterium]|nr:cob(I)yrinic acid a,c-diamide adenosyltransferase [Patescibacteria group bacterium]